MTGPDKTTAEKMRKTTDELHQAARNIWELEEHKQNTMDDYYRIMRNLDTDIKNAKVRYSNLLTELTKDGKALSTAVGIYIPETPVTRSPEDDPKSL